MYTLKVDGKPISGFINVPISVIDKYTTRFANAKEFLEKIGVEAENINSLTIEYNYNHQVKNREIAYNDIPVLIDVLNIEKPLSVDKLKKDGIDYKLTTVGNILDYREQVKITTDIIGVVDEQLINLFSLAMKLLHEKNRIFYNLVSYSDLYAREDLILFLKTGDLVYKYNAREKLRKYTEFRKMAFLIRTYYEVTMEKEELPVIIESDDIAMVNEKNNEIDRKKEEQDLINLREIYDIEYFDEDETKEYMEYLEKIGEENNYKRR